MERKMRRLDFDERWINRIMLCISRSHIGSRLMVAFFVRKLRQRELRQGDPLSNYLSLVCAVAFSLLLNKANMEGRLKEMKLCNLAPSFNHLLFSYDSLVLMKATTDYAMTL